MTTNKPEVKRYDCTSGGAQHCYGCYTMKETELGDYVEWEAYEALQAECEKLRKDAERYVPLNEAVQRAATELPEGWEIQLCVMRDSGWVDLIGPDGTEDFATDNERLDYTVIDALEFAIDAAMQGDQP